MVIRNTDGLTQIISQRIIFTSYLFFEASKTLVLGVNQKSREMNAQRVEVH